MAGLSIITFIEPKPTITLLLQGLVVSGIYYSSFVISFKVLETKDVTKLQPLSSLSNVFLVVLSIVFLERVLTIGTYLGILLITLGSALSLSITSKGRLDLNKTIGIYMVGVLLASLYSFSVELILQDGYSPLLLYGIYDSFSLLMLSPTLLKSQVRNEVLKTLKNPVKTLNVFLLKLLAPVSIVLYFIGLSKGPVEVVGSIFSLSSVGTLVVLLTLAKLGYSYEDRMTNLDILKKALAIILALLGLMMIKGYI